MAHRRVMFLGRPPSHAAREPPPGGKKALSPALPRLPLRDKQGPRAVHGRALGAPPLNLFCPLRGGRRGCAPHPTPTLFSPLRGCAGRGSGWLPPGLPLALQGLTLNGFAPASPAPDLAATRPFFRPSHGVLGGSRLDAMAPLRGPDNAFTSD